MQKTQSGYQQVLNPDLGGYDTDTPLGRERIEYIALNAPAGFAFVEGRQRFECRELSYRELEFKVIDSTGKSRPATFEEEAGIIDRMKRAQANNSASYPTGGAPQQQETHLYLGTFIKRAEHEHQQHALPQPKDAGSTPFWKRIIK